MLYRFKDDREFEVKNKSVIMVLIISEFEHNCLNMTCTFVIYRWCILETGLICVSLSSLEAHLTN